MLSPSQRWTEKGRRSMNPRPIPSFTNCPAFTEVATSAASNESTHMSRATWRLPASGASSRNTGPPFLYRAHLHLAGHCRRGLQQRRSRVQGGEAGDAALDRRPPDLESVLEDGPLGVAGLGVDVRHRVDDE